LIPVQSSRRGEATIIITDFSGVPGHIGRDRNIPQTAETKTKFKYC